VKITRRTRELGKDTLCPTWSVTLALIRRCAGISKSSFDTMERADGLEHVSGPTNALQAGVV
jgi:hypothetical protein